MHSTQKAKKPQKPRSRRNTREHMLKSLGNLTDMYWGSWCQKRLESIDILTVFDIHFFPKPFAGFFKATPRSKLFSFGLSSFTSSHISAPSSEESCRQVQQQLDLPVQMDGAASQTMLMILWKATTVKIQRSVTTLHVMDNLYQQALVAQRPNNYQSYSFREQTGLHEEQTQALPHNV